MLNYKRPYKIIALGGFKGVGKDTVADILCKRPGYYKVAFADALKDATRAIYGWLPDQESPTMKDVRDAHWGVSPRESWRDHGQGARKILRQDIWLKAFEIRVDRLLGQRWFDWARSPATIVIPDLRQHNELDLVLEKKARIVLIKRKNFFSDGHETEVMANVLDSFADVVIQNDGDKRSLVKKVKCLL